MGTRFIGPEDLYKIRELRLKQELAQAQMQSFGHAVQAELGRIYIKHGLAAEDSLNPETGAVTVAPRADVGPVPIDPGSRLTPGEAQVPGSPTFTA